MSLNSTATTRTTPEELAAYYQVMSKFRQVRSEMIDLETKRKNEHFLNRKNQEKWECLLEESLQIGDKLDEMESGWDEQTFREQNHLTV
jgi:hypothetical protein